MDFVQASILSLIEGITEFLPISSTAHLIIGAKILNIPQTDFIKTFEIAIQSGAILAAIFLYGKRLLKERAVLEKVIWAFIPTGVLGFLLYKLIKKFLIGNFEISLLALFLGGIIIIWAEKYFKRAEGEMKIKDLSKKQAVYIGIIQAISVIPGVSRSAATILGGMFFGSLKREEAVELSFMLAIPTMIAATSYDLIKSAEAFSQSELVILLFGVVISFVVAIFAMKWFLGFVRKYSLAPFGFYRIIIAGLFFLVLRLNLV